MQSLHAFPNASTLPLLRFGHNWSVDVLDARTRVVRRPSGLLMFDDAEDHDEGRNLVTTAGLAWVLAVLNGSGNTLGYMARGSSATAAAISQTALVAETERNAVTSAVLSSAQLVIQYLEPATSNNGQVFREAGLFDAASAGTMFNRWVHTLITKSSSIQILYSVTITVEEA